MFRSFTFQGAFATFPFVFWVWAGMAAEAQAEAAYTFTNIVDSNAGLGLYIGYPALNSSGTVAFYVNDGTGGGVYVSSGGVITPLMKSSSGGFDNPAITAAGSVAFAGPSGIYKWDPVDGGSVTTIAHSQNSPFQYFQPLVSITEAGTVAFTSSLDAGGSGVFVGSGGPVTTLAESSGSTFSGFGGGAAISEDGAVAFLARLDAGGEGVFQIIDGTVRTIVENTGSTFARVFNPTVNERGEVLFVAWMDDGTESLVSGSVNGLTFIARSSDSVFSSFSGLPSFNSSGTAAFRGDLDAGGQGLFTGTSLAIDTIILTGSPLFGSTLRTLGVGQGALNDVGQVAFEYQLADGRRGIALATPVPEPSTGVLAAFAVGLFGVRNRRKPLVAR